MRLYDGWATSTFDAQNASNEQMNNREGSRSNNFDFATSSKGLGGYSVVGMNVDKIPEVCNVITEYVNGIKEKIDGINVDAEANNAFKSEDVQNAVRAYNEKVKEWAMILVSDLLAFSDKLRDVRNTYVKNMASMSESISNATNAFDAGTEYKESIE